MVERYDPDFESMGLDECNMDVTQYCLENGIITDQDKQNLAKKIRKEV